MKHRVRIMQVFKVFRSIIVEVEAADMPSAIALVAEGELIGPSSTDPHWEDTWELQNEEVEAAK